MFWDMTDQLAPSAVEAILDKENFTLEELMDEDEILQECRAVNERLITFLSQKEQIKQLIEYMVVGAPDGAETRLRFPFIACEIFLSEVDIILRALVEDDELIGLLFSFLDPERHHTELLSRYFRQVVICLLMRKTDPLMSYIQAHQEDILRKLVDLIGITPVMEVLIRLLGANEHTYSSYPESMQWLQNTDVLEMIVNQFSLSDSPEVHCNAAETLCAINRYAPPVLASKISSPSFIEKLFHHALEESRPQSVLVNLLIVCMSLLDPRRVASGLHYLYNQQTTRGSGLVVNPEIVAGMLKSLGDLLRLLDLSSEDNVLLTTYGKLQPPFGKHRLKVVEFISVLVAASNGVAEKELIRLGAIKHIVELLFEYPFNNFLHHHVERVVESCLESKNSQLIEHLLRDCNLIGKILEAENPNLAANTSKHTLPAEGKSLPRIGNVGHLTRIANKIVQMGNSHGDIQKLLQENSDWVDWQASVLLQRNLVENVLHWDCGRPVSLPNESGDSDEDDYQDRDYDVAALGDSLSPAFRYGIYSGGDTHEAHGSLARIDEEFSLKLPQDDYFDDEFAEGIIASLNLDDQQRSSLSDDKGAADSVTSSYSYIGGNDDMASIWSSIVGARERTSVNAITANLSNSVETDISKPEKSPEWRESAVSVDKHPKADGSDEPGEAQSPSLADGERVTEDQTDVASDKKDADKPEDDSKTDGKGLLDSHQIVDSVDGSSQSREMSEKNVNINEVVEDSSKSVECDKPEDDCKTDDGKGSVDSHQVMDSAADSSQSGEMSERNANVDE